MLLPTGYIVSSATLIFVWTDFCLCWKYIVLFAYVALDSSFRLRGRVAGTAPTHLFRSELLSGHAQPTTVSYSDTNVPILRPFLHGPAYVCCHIGVYGFSILTLCHSAGLKMWYDFPI